MTTTIQDLFLGVLEQDLKDRVAAALTGQGSSRLLDMVTYHMGWHTEAGGKHGKRLRPYILLLCTANTGGEWQNALPAAAAIEFIHNFSLVHDDIQDKGMERHGRPTVWNRCGIPQAINAGDGLMNLAGWTLEKLHAAFPQPITEKIDEIFFDTINNLILGQVMDLDFEEREDVSLDEYIEMVKGKTGALIKASTLIGTILGHANDSTAFYAARFGLNLGLAFQVLDDLLGIWGNPLETGKPVNIDLQDRKKSLPIIYGLQNDTRFLELWHAKDWTPAIIAQGAAFLEESGAKTYCQQTATKFTQEALTAMDEIHLSDNPYWNELRSLTLSLLARDR